MLSANLSSRAFSGCGSMSASTIRQLNTFTQRQALCPSLNNTATHDGFSEQKIVQSGEVSQRSYSSSTATTSEDLSLTSTDNKRFSHTAAQALPKSLPAMSVTSWISDVASRTMRQHLSDITVHRSKRMLLDTLGVGVLGADTEISRQFTRATFMLGQGGGAKQSEGGAGKRGCRVGGTGAVLWGSRSTRASPVTAAYLNGVSVHSMDMDDTWHPATHPSGPTLPAVLALAETLQHDSAGSVGVSLEDVLVAYNVGIQVQGLLLRSAKSACNIPSRFHPPAVVGVMGSAAACANLMGLGPAKCRAALGIAASNAGAPMANAGTTTKPLHAGKAARAGLEAAFLADQGIEGNPNILDMPSGFGAFYEDFDPEALLAENASNSEFLLHHQDIALKRFPAHLGMHWTIDAAMSVRANLAEDASVPLDLTNINKILIRAPPSKYINRPLPASEHEARHSFQFNACTALLDGQVIPASYHDSARTRPELLNLLSKTEIETPEDNHASFNEMYVEVCLFLKDGSEVKGRCDTPYGHWRNPLSDADVVRKFERNTAVLPHQSRQEIVRLVQDMSPKVKATELTQLLHAY
ncbi:cis-aconitate decarboxylase [Plakobranchus ocellatus]|uniref:Cis-aconitate decarboxylase n=1 Tax=Plakobranchus ocellatus TaxID=259542 RepID=A0AAV3ZWI9_9GAST|nr:cis-aconitate decarboxylase [Plakobranchus ocellatus]